MVSAPKLPEHWSPKKRALFRKTMQLVNAKDFKEAVRRDVISTLDAGFVEPSDYDGTFALPRILMKRAAKGYAEGVALVSDDALLKKYKGLLGGRY